jgi:hypothetical protein
MLLFEVLGYVFIGNGRASSMAITGRGNEEVVY